MSFLYLASQVPLVQAIPTPPSISGCTNNTTTAGTTSPIQSSSPPIATILNQFFANTAASFGFSGGFGVINGLVLSTGASLALSVSAGNAAILGTDQYTGGTVVCPDNTSLGFVWLNQNGTLTATATVTPPATNCVYIGNFTTLSGSVTVVDYSGVPYCVNGGIIRYVNDIGAPADSPNAGTIYHSVTPTGTYHWNGSAYNALQPVTGGALQYTATLTTTFQFLPQHNGHVFNFAASGGNITLLLPNPSDLPANWSITIYNVGASNSLLVKDYTNTTTLSTVSTTNSSLYTYTYLSSGVVVFPSGTWSAGARPAPGAAPA